MPAHRSVWRGMPGATRVLNTVAVISPRNKLGIIPFTNGDGGDNMILGTVRLQFFYQRMIPLINTWYEK